MRVQSILSGERTGKYWNVHFLKRFTVVPKGRVSEEICINQRKRGINTQRSRKETVISSVLMCVLIVVWKYWWASSLVSTNSECIGNTSGVTQAELRKKNTCFLIYKPYKSVMCTAKDYTELSQASLTYKTARNSPQLTRNKTRLPQRFILTDDYWLISHNMTFLLLLF